MKVSDPIIDASYGPLAIRLSLGGYFFLAGMLKLENISSFIQIVQETKVIAPHLAQLIGILIPYFEVVVGAALILGFWTTLAASTACVLLISYIYAMGIFLHQGSSLFNKDIILLAASTSLLGTGCGAFGIDKIRK